MDQSVFPQSGLSGVGDRGGCIDLSENNIGNK